MFQKLKNQYFTTFLLGSLSAGAFAPLYFFPLSIIAFSGLFLISDHCKNNKKSFWVGWCFGFGQFVFGLYWISISLFVDINKFFWLLPFALFLIPAVLAIYIGLVLLLTNFIAKKFLISNWRKILLLAVIWVVFEYLRAILFTGFPWNLLGYSLLFSLSLSQAASVLGIYGLSLIAVIFCSAPALLFQLQNKKITFSGYKKHQLFLCSVLAILSLIWFSGWYRLKYFVPKTFPNSTFRLVQPNIKQEEKWSSEYRYNSFLENINLSHQAGFENINYVVWSESAVPYVINPIISYGLLADIASAVPKNSNSLLITGALRANFKDGDKELEKIWNTVFVINNQAKVVETYDKNHLVPFGEYIPFADLFPLFSKITDGGMGFSTGSGNKTINLGFNLPSFSPLVCYEIIFPDNIIDKSNPPQFLLNLTNDAWFGSSSGPYQHFDMAKMRSIEYGISTIRVANSGISGLINPVGELVAAIPLNHKGVLDVMLVEKLPDTIYLKYGNIMLLFISSLLLGLAFCKKTKL